MKSPHTWFADTFRGYIYQRLMSAYGPYETFRTKYPSLARVPYDIGDRLFEEWKQQLPTHQFQQLSLKSGQVREGYVEFIINEFDIWFAQYLASGISP